MSFLRKDIVCAVLAMVIGAPAVAASEPRPVMDLPVMQVSEYSVGNSFDKANLLFDRLQALLVKNDPSAIVHLWATDFAGGRSDRIVVTSEFASPDEMGQLVAHLAVSPEYQRWKEVARAAGVRKEMENLLGSLKMDSFPAPDEPNRPDGTPLVRQFHEFNVRGNGAAFINLFNRVNVMHRRHQTHASVRLWRTSWGGPEVDRYMVTVEFPNWRALTDVGTSIEETPEWAQLQKDMGALDMVRLGEFIGTELPRPKRAVR